MIDRDELKCGPQWYTVRVKSNRERAVYEHLVARGCEGFLPFYNQVRHWPTRTRVIESPLFPGYVFCHIELENRIQALTIPGVLHFVGIGRTPTPIHQREVSRLKLALRSASAVEPCGYLNVGQPVIVTSGALRGLDGILIQNKSKCRVVISIGLLQRSVAVEVGKDAIRGLTVPPERGVSLVSR